MNARLLISTLAVVLTVASAASAQTSARRPQQPASQAPSMATPIEPRQQYCRQYGLTDPKVVLFGIDRTIGRMRSVDLNALDNAYADVLRSLDEGQRLVIFTIQDHFTSRRVLFDDCRPGTPTLCTTCTPAEASVQRHDQAQFRSSLDQLIRSLRTEQMPHAGRSAVFSTINSMVTGNERELRHLFVVTDLLESDVLSLSPPRLIEEHERNAAIRRLRDNGLLPDLSRAEVHVYGYGRADNDPYPPIETQAMESIVRLWRAYFNRGGADRIEFRP